MTLTVTSSAFADGEPIPVRYTCDGADVSPPLAWSGVPEGTRSVALIVDDPDAPDPAAPKMVFVHWVLYNLPPNCGGLDEDAGAKGLPAAAGQGLNDWKRTGYGGPCPPIGTHRYFHKVYALDRELPDLGTPTRAELEQAMQGHVLANAQLVGTFRRAGRR